MIDGDRATGERRRGSWSAAPARRSTTTGIGPGFSGSPIYCADAAGVPRRIGAISESVGEYGGKVVLATPIEAILGTPVDPPAAGAPQARAVLAARPPAGGAAHRRRASRRARQRARAAAAQAGRVVLAAPAGPLGSFPVQTLRPGSASASATRPAT